MVYFSLTLRKMPARGGSAALSSQLIDAAGALDDLHAHGFGLGIDRIGGDFAFFILRRRLWRAEHHAGGSVEQARRRRMPPHRSEDILKPVAMHSLAGGEEGVAIAGVPTRITPAP